jgi:hypothetical protein
MLRIAVLGYHSLHLLINNLIALFGILVTVPANLVPWQLE